MVSFDIWILKRLLWLRATTLLDLLLVIGGELIYGRGKIEVFVDGWVPARIVPGLCLDFLPRESSPYCSRGGRGNNYVRYVGSCNRKTHPRPDSWDHLLSRESPSPISQRRLWYNRPFSSPQKASPPNPPRDTVPLVVSHNCHGWAYGRYAVPSSRRFGKGRRR